MLKKVSKHQMDYVQNNCSWLPVQNRRSITGDRDALTQLLQAIDPVKYCRTRNFLDGAVTYLSPYIRHGMITLKQVMEHALSCVDDAKKIEKFIQELGWRDYWQRLYYHYPDYIWTDVAAYKTGFLASDYADQLPLDICDATTPNACINYFIATLVGTGYLHNHARMYLAAYVVHWRRVKWQVGAKWMHHYLMDGDLGSNNLSWQWVASTFSHKPYIFNLDNVRKYATSDINVSADSNPELNFDYDTLSVRLFPNKGGMQ